jgi:glycosyltransferase involved in cell wall biosynthesis
MGSIPDVVVDGESGLLVEPDDPAALAAAIDRLRSEPGLSAALAEGGRRRVEEHFDQARSHERLRAEIARLLAAREQPYAATSPGGASTPSP